MSALVHRRLRNERDLLQRALPSLREFVEPPDERGDPPTAYRFALRPFGFLVRRDDATEPEPFAPARHGPAVLLLTTDPRLHPLQPWRVLVHTQPGATAFSPHVGGVGVARGAVCWTDARKGHGVHDWPLPKVVAQALRILAGESLAFEGFALHEDAKAWFARNRSRLPLARVPEPPVADAPCGAGAPSPRIGASALGIEFGEMSR